MALVTPDLQVPPVGDLFPTTRRWRKVKPCGTLAAWRRHQRRKEPSDPACREAHARDMVRRRARSSGGA